MTEILIVRHGKAASGWGDDLDPGLDNTGQMQALNAAAEIHSMLELPDKTAIVSSPLRRAIETAKPLVDRWSRPLEVNASVAEIPSPSLSMDERMPWLRMMMADRWSNLSPELQDWRSQVIAAVANVEMPTVFFSHFIVLNVLVGYLTNDDRVVNFYPENCSITRLCKFGRTLSLDRKGEEGNTAVN